MAIGMRRPALLRSGLLTAVLAALGAGPFYSRIAPIIQNSWAPQQGQTGYRKKPRTCTAIEKRKAAKRRNVKRERARRRA